MEDDNDEFTFIELETIKKDETVPSSDVFSTDFQDYDSGKEGEEASSFESSSRDEESIYEVEIKEDESECSDTETSAPKTGGFAQKSSTNKSVGKFKKKKHRKSSKSGTSAKKSKLKQKRKRNSNPRTPKSPGVKKPKCEYPRLCSGCGHAYKTKQSFWNHKQRCTMLPQNNRSNAVDENGCPIGNGENGEFVRRKEYICAHCERPYRKKYNLQEHLRNTCKGKPCSKGRLQCWEEGCLQAFYKYVDLVQHVTLQHGQDLQIQKLQFPNFSAFNSWKTEESNSKFMYARKITGSKRFSNTKYHYFVCQFNHRNEKKNNNRKTNRRKSVNLVVPNYNCPSRIMVKECENQIQVTYISSHNHELNLSNVKYQPLEKETRAYIKTLLQLGVSAKKIKEHLQEGVGNPEIDSFLATKQHFLTLNRIKRMESKLKAKNRARQLEISGQEKNITNDTDSVSHDDSFEPCDDGMDHVLMDPATAVAVAAAATCSTTVTPSVTSKSIKKESDEVVKSIESNLKKLRGYMHKANIKERLSDRISKMIQDLCTECENMEGAPNKKPRTNTRKKKAVLADVPSTLPVQPQPQSQPHLAPQPQAQQQLQIHIQPVLPPQAIIHQTMTIQQQPMIQQHQLLQHQPIQQPQQQQPVLLHQHQVISTMDQTRIVNTAVNNVIRNDKSFTPVINETSDLLKPMLQPFNINLLCLKSIDTYISPHEVQLLKSVDESFTLGWLCDAVVDSFMNLICQPLGNVLAADTSISQYIQTHQKVPDVWHCFNWNNIDTIFIPCNPSKKHWFLLVVLVKQSELQILDPASSYETFSNILKKYAASINSWYNVLRNFLGILQCNVTSPPHAKQTDPANCGVLVCWYVFQYINKRSLDDSVDPDIFRKYVYNTIVTNSQQVE